MTKYNTNLILHAADIDDFNHQFNLLFKALQKYNIDNPNDIIKFDFRNENDELTERTGDK